MLYNFVVRVRDLFCRILNWRPPKLLLTLERQLSLSPDIAASLDTAAHVCKVIDNIKKVANQIDL